MPTQINTTANIVNFFGASQAAADGSVWAFYTDTPFYTVDPNTFQLVANPNARVLARKIDGNGNPVGAEVVLVPPAADPGSTIIGAFPTVLSDGSFAVSFIEPSGQPGVPPSRIATYSSAGVPLATYSVPGAMGIVPTAGGAYDLVTAFGDANGGSLTIAHYANASATVPTSVDTVASVGAGQYVIGGESFSSAGTAFVASTMNYSAVNTAVAPVGIASATVTLPGGASFTFNAPAGDVQGQTYHLVLASNVERAADGSYYFAVNSITSTAQSGNPGFFDQTGSVALYHVAPGGQSQIVTTFVPLASVTPGVFSMAGFATVSLLPNGNIGLKTTAMQQPNFMSAAQFTAQFSQFTTAGVQVGVTNAMTGPFLPAANTLPSGLGELVYFDNGNISVTTLASGGAGGSMLFILRDNTPSWEGNGGSTPFTFTVGRAGDTSGATTVDWGVSSAGFDSFLADGADFVGGVLPSGTVSFAAGETSKVITVNVAGDLNAEGNDWFTVTLSNPSAGATIMVGQTATAILSDDLAGDLIAIDQGGHVAMEGNDGTTTPYTFTVYRTGDTSATRTMNWAVSGFAYAPTGQTAADAADFVGGVLPSGALSFAAGEASKTITVNVAGDTTVEGNDGFQVTLSNASAGGTIVWSNAVGIIWNDEGLTGSTLSIAATSADKPEGNSGTTPYTFTVSRTGDTSGATSANWAVSGAAVTGADFVGGALPTGTVSFAAGEISKVVTVNVAGDAIAEIDEGFAVTLSNPSVGASIATASATGTIRNDDISPVIDTAANISANFDAYVAAPPPSITVTDNAPLALSIAQINAGAAVLAKVKNADLTPYKLDVVDSAAHIEAAIAALNANTHLNSITLTDAVPPTPFLALNIAKVLANGTAIGKIVSGFTINVLDTVATIQALTAAQIATLDARHVASLVATPPGAINISVAQFKALSAADISIQTASGVTLRDTPANLATLTVAQISSLSEIGVTGLLATSVPTKFTKDQAMALTFEGLTSVLPATAGAFVVNDAPAIIAAMTQGEMHALKLLGFSGVSSTAPIVIDIAGAGLFGSEGLKLIGVNIKVQDTPTNIQAITQGLADDLKAAGVTSVAAQGTTPFTLTVAQAAILQLDGVKLTGAAASILDTAANIAAITQQQADALKAAVYKTIVSSTGAVELSVTTAALLVADGLTIAIAPTQVNGTPDIALDWGASTPAADGSRWAFYSTGPLSDANATVIARQIDADGLPTGAEVVFDVPAAASGFTTAGVSSANFNPANGSFGLSFLAAGATGFTTTFANYTGAGGAPSGAPITMSGAGFAMPDPILGNGDVLSAGHDSTPATIVNIDPNTLQQTPVWTSAPAGNLQAIGILESFTADGDRIIGSWANSAFTNQLAVEKASATISILPAGGGAARAFTFTAPAADSASSVTILAPANAVKGADGSFYFAVDTVKSSLAAGKWTTTDSLAVYRVAPGAATATKIATITPTASVVTPAANLAPVGNFVGPFLPRASLALLPDGNVAVGLGRETNIFSTSAPVTTFAVLTPAGVTVKSATLAGAVAGRLEVLDNGFVEALIAQPSGAGVYNVVRHLLSDAGALIVHDTAANISAALDALNLNKQVAFITLSDPGAPLNLTVKQALADTVALGKITGPHSIVVTDSIANLAALTPAKRASLAGIGVTFAVVDTAAKIAAITTAQAQALHNALPTGLGLSTIASSSGDMTMTAAQGAAKILINNGMTVTGGLLKVMDKIAAMTALSSTALNALKTDYGAANVGVADLAATIATITKVQADKLAAAGFTEIVSTNGKVTLTAAVAARLSTADSDPGPGVTLSPLLVVAPVVTVSDKIANLVANAAMLGQWFSQNGYAIAVTDLALITQPQAQILLGQGVSSITTPAAVTLSAAQAQWLFDAGVTVLGAPLTVTGAVAQLLPGSTANFAQIGAEVLKVVDPTQIRVEISVAEALDLETNHLALTSALPIQITDAAINISNLSAAELSGLTKLGVKKIVSTDGLSVTLDVEEARALKTTKIPLFGPSSSTIPSGGQIVDAAAAVQGLTTLEIQALKGLGLKEIEIASGDVVFSAAQTTALLSQGLLVRPAAGASVKETFINTDTAKLADLGGSYELTLTGPAGFIYSAGDSTTGDGQTAYLSTGVQKVVGPYGDGASVDIHAEAATKTDTFVFTNAGFGDAQIYGFVAGAGATHDVLQFRATDFGVTLSAGAAAIATAIAAHVTSGGVDTTITTVAGDTVTLMGVTPDLLGAADFKIV